MKRLPLTFMLLAAVSLGACSGEPDAYMAGADDGAGAAAPATTTVAPDPAFVNDVATAGDKEIEMARIAQQRAVAPDVQGFADRMIRDHQQASEELRQALTGTSVVLTVDTDAIQTAGHTLADLSGAEFDRAYMDMMVTDHERAVALVEAKANGSGNAAVKQWAAKVLPTLKEHLQQAKAIRESLGGS
ncbi:MAG: DUF4142 domain-containing protein [Vicinamibacterales bacterium]